MEQQEGGKLTIREIAEELGVSITTVSRSLSGKGRIGPETRARVLEYVNRTGKPAPGQTRAESDSLILVVPHRFVRLDLPFLRGRGLPCGGAAGTRCAALLRG